MKIICPHCGKEIELSAAEVAALMGSLTSERKAKASAANGKKGGRPKKKADNIFKVLRKKCRLTLREASASAGISISFLSDIEHGRTPPSLKTLEALAATYGTSASKILELS